jgi:hypothetical protein
MGSRHRHDAPDRLKARIATEYATSPAPDFGRLQKFAERAFTFS